MAMMAVPETFNSSNFSYHQRQDGQHDFNSVWEFCYNAFPFMFPTSQNSAITEILSDSPKKLQGIYTLDRRKVEEADKGIYIIDGKKTAKR
ncbi:MAG: hypothetical protein K2L45_08290 [Muribaculaceae bacterium]|nr:hypothetical protein [Muribaculaceae bacterium]